MSSVKTKWTLFQEYDVLWVAKSLTKRDVLHLLIVGMSSIVCD